MQYRIAFSQVPFAGNIPSVLPDTARAHKPRRLSLWTFWPSCTGPWTGLWTGLWTNVWTGVWTGLGTGVWTGIWAGLLDWSLDWYSGRVSGLICWTGGWAGLGTDLRASWSSESLLVEGRKTVMRGKAE